MVFTSDCNINSSHDFWPWISNRFRWHPIVQGSRTYSKLIRKDSNQCRFWVLPSKSKDWNWHGEVGNEPARLFWESVNDHKTLWCFWSIFLYGTVLIEFLPKNCTNIEDSLIEDPSHSYSLMKCIIYLVLTWNKTWIYK